MQKEGKEKKAQNFENEIKIIKLKSQIWEKNLNY